MHLSAIGHPIVGDALYGGVHAGACPAICARRRISSARSCTPRGSSFTHPADGRRMEFTSALPDDLQRVLDELREGQLRLQN